MDPQPHPQDPDWRNNLRERLKRIKARKDRKMSNEIQDAATRAVDGEMKQLFEASPAGPQLQEIRVVNYGWCVFVNGAMAASRLTKPAALQLAKAQAAEAEQSSIVVEQVIRQ